MQRSVGVRDLLLVTVALPSRASFRTYRLAESRMSSDRAAAAAAFRFLLEHNECCKTLLQMHTALLDIGAP